MFVKCYKLTKSFFDHNPSEIRNHALRQIGCISTVEGDEIASENFAITIENSLMTNNINSQMFESYIPGVEEVIDFILKMNI